MSLPRITVITPSYNQAAYLERTIRSVLDQGYVNLEYMVIDGGSSDGSREIIQRHAPRLSYWVSEPDRGQTHAINKGLHRATGDIIAFLNSDDLYLPGTLRRVAQIMGAPENGTPLAGAQWLVGACLQIDTQDHIIGRFQHSLPQSLASYLGRIDGLLPQPSSFWSADLFRRLGGFDLNLHCSFDYEFNCRLLANGVKPHLIAPPLASFRVHGESKGGSQPIRFGLERITIAQRYAHHLPWPQRLALFRNLGYRRRRYAIQIARQQGMTLWRDVAKRPWWLASSEVRKALRAAAA